MNLHEAFTQAGSWPLPGGGDTAGRWSALASLAEDDLVVARLAEAHADALAILAELGAAPPPADSRWGVWAAEAPGFRVTAHRVDDGWRINGCKAWCSGATLLTHALVTAWAGGSGFLMAVDLHDSGVVPGPDSWASSGMKGADTRTVTFTDVRAGEVGAAGKYLDRPGFWVGGIGVAACWFGGAVGVGRTLRDAVAIRPEPHAAAHLGAVDLALDGVRQRLRAAAREVDAAPFESHETLARRVRGATAQAASEVIDRVGRALGPGPLAGDPQHAQRVADLSVYVRQDHAEKDLAALGNRVALEKVDWSL